MTLFLKFAAGCALIAAAVAFVLTMLDSMSCVQGLR